MSDYPMMIEHHITTLLNRLERALTEPINSTDTLMIQRKSRFLALMLLIMIALFLSIDSFQLSTNHTYQAPWYGYLFLGAAYLLNRTYSYRLAANLTIVMFPLVIFMNLVNTPAPTIDSIMPYLVLSLFFASMFASRLGMLLLATINLAGFLLLPLLIPEKLPGVSGLLTPLAVNTIGMALVLLYIQHRDRIEHDQQAMLRDSEERLHLALNAANMGTWSWNIDTDTIEWSVQSAHLFGQPAETLTKTYTVYLDLVHPDDRPAIERAISATLAGEIADFCVEHRLICPNGRMHWIEGRGRRSNEPKGKARRLIGTVIDITARKQAQVAQEQAEAARTRTELRFRALINDCADAVALFSLDGFVEYASPATARILGYNLDFYAGQDAGHFIHPDDLPQVIDQFNQLIQGPQSRATIEVRVRHRDGSWRWIEASAVNAIADPAIAGIVVNFHDMTERKQAEEALRENEERYRVISELVSDYAFAYHIAEDGTSRLAWMTDAFTRATGYTLGEMRELQNWLAIVHPDDLSIAHQHTRMMESGQAHIGEYRVIARDQRLLWLRMYGYPVRDEQTGRVIRIYGAAQDMTIIKELEQQLRQAQRMEAIGLLAGGIAHDFNNLLTIILGSTTMLLDSEPDPHTLRHDIEQINAAAARAAALTRQLLAFGRQQLLEPQLININSVVAGVEPLLRRLIGNDITLVTQLAPKLGLLKADPGQLEQVLMNLVVNARDAMPIGGVLKITTAQLSSTEVAALPYVSKPATHAATLNTQSHGPSIALIIRDTGIGMNQSTRARIFEPFYTTKALGKGTGLGLAIVHGIISQSGGQIAVESEPGNGTTITIILPGVDPAIETPHNADLAIPHLPGTATILLVEDNLTVRSLTARILRKHGYQILEAGDSLSALQALNTYQGPIQVLLTDIHIPGGINGYQLAEQISAQHPAIKVLFMSGYPEHTQTQAHLLPNQSFVEKPFTLERLLQAVTLAVQERS